MFNLIWIFSLVSLILLTKSEVINFNIIYMLFNLLYLSKIFFWGYGLPEGFLLLAVSQIFLCGIIAITFKLIDFKEDRKASE